MNTLFSGYQVPLQVQKYKESKARDINFGMNSRASASSGRLSPASQQTRALSPTTSSDLTKSILGGKTNVRELTKDITSKRIRDRNQFSNHPTPAGIQQHIQREVIPRWDGVAKNAGPFLAGKRPQKISPDSVNVLVNAVGGG
jgi:hypothetical protein